MADEDILPLLGINMPGDDSDESDDTSDENNNDMEEERQEEENEQGKKEEKKKEKKKTKRQESSTSISYDQSLPSSHTYLGDDLEEVRGRTILEEESELTLPLITLPGTILVPGQIIPLHLFHQQTVAMIRGVIDSDKTFGVVTVKQSLEDYSTSLAGIGTTAEIFSIKNEMDEGSGISTVRVKARGRQRFELIEYKRSVTGVLVGKVKILKDVSVCDVFEGARPPSHCKFCCLDDEEEEENLKTAVDRQGRIFTCVNMRRTGKVNRFTSAHFTWWPPWVYKMYDTAILVRRTKSELQKWNETLSPEKMPDDATELSYWVTQNLPLDDSLRLHLLSLNNAIQRLRCALSMIIKYSILCCRECNQQVADKCDVFSLSYEGPLAAYVNPGGHVHETLTVYKVHNLHLIGRPSTEHSWFPGYAWTIAQCKNCTAHMGWKFTARRKELEPQKFWGLCRASLVPGLSNPDDTDASDWLPVM